MATTHHHAEESAVSLSEIAATTTSPAASLSRALLSRFPGSASAPVTVTSPAGPRQVRVEPPSMTLVNLSGHVLRLVRIDGAVTADSLPPTGVLVRRGEELSFGVAPGLAPDESVVAQFEVVDPSGPACAHLYPVVVSPDQGGRSNGAARTLPGALGSPLTQVHLTQDHIVLRNSAEGLHSC